MKVEITVFFPLPFDPATIAEAISSGAVAMGGMKMTITLSTFSSARRTARLLR